MVDFDSVSNPRIEDVLELLDLTGSVFYVHDVDAPRTMRYFNSAITDLTGFRRIELIGRPITELVVPSDVTDHMEALESGPAVSDARIRCRDGSLKWVRASSHRFETDEGPRIAGIAVLIDSLKSEETELRRQVDTDSLTGLLSREAFMRRMLESLDEAPDLVAVGIADLDAFKQVNDTLGHPVGDEFLRAVGERLADLATEDILIARLGGDEFGLLMTDAHSVDLVEETAERILETIAQPVVIEGIELQSRASIGISLGNADSTSTDMMRHADMAMYEAKRTRSGFRTYTRRAPGMPKLDLSSAAELSRSLEDQLTMWFQPIVDLSSGDAIAVEALVRWDHPERGLLRPSHFLSAIERGGLSARLDLFALESAAAISAARTRLGSRLKLAINITAEGLRSPQLIPRIRALRANGALGENQLIVEISERDIQEDLSSMHQVLYELRSSGVGLALDDFGTGFSSLIRLRDLPFNEVKIDRSFVSRILDDHTDRAIVRSTVELGQSLGMRVVAEGIEDAETARALIEMGCRRGQGYYYARPAPLEELVEASRFTLPFLPDRSQLDNGSVSRTGR